MQHKVKVVHVGYFWVDDKTMAKEYEADTVQEAVDNQLKWYNAGESGSIDEIVSDWDEPTMTLTGETSASHVDM
jgi:hypothetical protein